MKLYVEVSAVGLFLLSLLSLLKMGKKYVKCIAKPVSFQVKPRFLHDKSMNLIEKMVISHDVSLVGLNICRKIIVLHGIIHSIFLGGAG